MSEVLSIIDESNLETRNAHHALGDRGEALAAEFLKMRGYTIVMANFKVPVGRNTRGVQITGEIDLIALDGDTLCFIEVKTRRSENFTPVITNVDLRKQRQIIRTAKIYRRIFDLNEISFRYDVVTVLMPTDSDHKIELTKDYWSEGKFRKRKWNDRMWDDFY